MVRSAASNGAANSMPSSDISPAITEALAGSRGPSQQAIAQTGLDLVDLLLRKNSDYGSAVFDPPILAPHITAEQAINTRLSDKFSRLANLRQRFDVAGADEWAEVDESITDTIRDVAGYCILLLTLTGEVSK